MNITAPSVLESGSELKPSRWCGWNVLLTVQPVPGAMRQVLDGLHKFGEFRITPFHCVCIGLVGNPITFLEALLEAQHAGRHWTKNLARVVPLQCTFAFAPDSLEGKLESVLVPIAEEIESGTFFVRVERRGLAEQIHAAQVESMAAGQLFRAAGSRGKTLHTAFDDPDYIVAVETVDTQCGVGLISRDLRRRYPLVRVT